MADTDQTSTNDLKTAGDTPLSPTIKALGVVSLCADLSSEMVYPITPTLLTAVLGAPAWTVGLIEGVAESTASILKLYSGRISDRLGQRKPLTIGGYSLAAVAKPLLGMATSWGAVLAARFLDRTGKGLRTAPRDALIAESCPSEIRGRAFGFHRSMDTIGAVVGPLVGWLYLRTHPGALRSLYMIAFVPGVVGVLVLAAFVREKARSPRPPAPSDGLRLPLWRSISPQYRTFLVIVAIFSLGNSSDALLLLRAKDLGMSADKTLLLYALFNVVEATLGYFAGGLSDRIGRKPLLVGGWLVFAAVYLGFALATGAAAVWPLFIMYGLYYTLTQGVQKALAADFADPSRRAEEIGLFHMVLGILAFPASLVAGILYDRLAPAAPFFLGACTALAAAILLACLSRRPSPDAL